MDCFFKRRAVPLVCMLFVAALPAAPAGALSAAALPRGDGDGGRQAVDDTQRGTLPATDAADTRSGSGSMMVLAVIGGIIGVAFGRWFGRNVLPWAAAGVLLGAGSWAIVEGVFVMLTIRLCLTPDRMREAPDRRCSHYRPLPAAPARRMSRRPHPRTARPPGDASASKTL